MINYSIVMRGNPTDKTVAKKAYASAQSSEVMGIDRFAGLTSIAFLIF